MPLVAIANPAQYVTHPLRVFELDFEANLDIVRHCVKYNKRLIFPSTSEIYGMSPDAVLDEEMSPLVYGPINKQRWIYAASKQLLDRVIYAYGVRDNLDYTLFRPFNFIGPNLDNVEEPKEGSSRVFTQFLSNVLYKRPIKLVDGGSQKRSFTYIDDAIDVPADDPREQGRRASRRIFNIGNPANCISIRDLAQRTIRIAQEFPVLRDNASATEIVDVSAGEYYGKYYQDIQVRVPNVEAARRDLGWAPTHRHGHRHPAHHRLLREAGRLRHARWRPWRRSSARAAASVMDGSPRARASGAPARLAGVAGAGGRLVRDPAGAPAARSGRGPLRRDSARDARQRRLDHAALRRPEVLREAAAAVLGDRRGLFRVRRQRVELAAVERADWRSPACRWCLPGWRACTARAARSPRCSPSPSARSSSWSGI